MVTPCSVDTCLSTRERGREKCALWVYLKSQMNCDKTPKVVIMVLFPFSYFIDETTTVFNMSKSLRQKNKNKEKDGYWGWWMDDSFACIWSLTQINILAFCWWLLENEGSPRVIRLCPKECMNGTNYANNWFSTHFSQILKPHGTKEKSGETVSWPSVKFNHCDVT